MHAKPNRPKTRLLSRSATVVLVGVSLALLGGPSCTETTAHPKQAQTPAAAHQKMAVGNDPSAPIFDFRDLQNTADTVVVWENGAYKHVPVGAPKAAAKITASARPAGQPLDPHAPMANTADSVVVWENGVYRSVTVPRAGMTAQAASHQAASKKALRDGTTSNRPMALETKPNQPTEPRIGFDDPTAPVTPKPASTKPVASKPPAKPRPRVVESPVDFSDLSPAPVASKPRIVESPIDFSDTPPSPAPVVSKPARITEPTPEPSKTNPNTNVAAEQPKSFQWPDDFSSLPAMTEVVEAPMMADTGPMVAVVESPLSPEDFVVLPESAIASTPIATQAPVAPTTPKPVSQPKPVAATPVKPPVAPVQPAVGATALGKDLSNLGWMLGIGAALAALATLIGGVMTGRITDGAGVRHRALTLRARTIIACGTMATLAVASCAVAAMNAWGIVPIIAGAACTAIVPALLCVWLNRAVSAPAADITASVRSLAAGELTRAPMNSPARDEMGELSRAVDRLSASVRDALTEVAITTTEVAGAATQFAGGIKQASTAATEAAKKCAEAAQAAASSSHDTSEAHSAIRQTALGIGTLKQVVRDQAAGVEAITAHAQKASKLVKTIDELAERTHVAALNASVEASRCGPQTRAFSAMAEEARVLCEQARAAVVEAVKSIETVDTQARTVGEKSGAAEQRIREGMDLATKAVAAFDRVASRAGTITECIKTAATAAEEAGADATQSAAAAAAAAARTEQLTTIMNRFKLGTERVMAMGNRSAGVPAAH